MSSIDLNGVCPLQHWGVLRAQGSDAAKFLHGQLTNDVALLPIGHARLAAYCSPKGRMLASFVLVKRSDDELLLVCQRDLLAPTLKRLSMFVMRAQVRLSDATDAWALWGVAGATQLPGLSAPWSTATAGDASVVQLYPADGVGRQLWLAPVGSSAPAGAALAPAVWDWSDVASGIASVQAATAEMFVPQMLNYESVGGVNFKKGCYPGQEVVARSQFRGTLKRRTWVARLGHAAQAGHEVFAGNDAEQPVGQVVQAAAVPDGSGDWLALLCLQTGADMADLWLQPGRRGAIHLQSLPYALLEDV